MCRKTLTTIIKTSTRDRQSSEINTMKGRVLLLIKIGEFFTLNDRFAHEINVKREFIIIHYLLMSKVSKSSLICLTWAELGQISRVLLAAGLALLSQY